MYCLFCGSSIPEDAPFCLKCGKLTLRGNGEAGKRGDTPTLASVLPPSDPYNLRPATFYGPLPQEGNMQNPYMPSNPYAPLAPPPPRQRRFSSGFFKGLFCGILVIFLLSGGLGVWLFFKQGTPSHSIPSSVKPTATHQLPVTPQPTAHSTVAVANTTSQSLPGTWTQCALETATCNFTGTMTVAFGANGSFHYATKRHGVACTIDTFGDPLYKTAKACYIEAAPATTNVWARCASEGAACSFLGTMVVAFGANGSFHYATKTNGSDCNTSVFGDPSYSVAKSCYLISPPTNATTWNSCATENNTCSFSGRHEVAYGGNGEYFYGSFTNGTACTNSIFGDPAIGAAKTCYYQ